MLLRYILIISTLVLPTIKGSTQAQSPIVSLRETADKYGPSLNASRMNAPYIFNSIHSSLRQWGSSLYHNGMSIFPARIPNNTLLYHGTNKALAATGMQWLAFEIEHAELFSQPRVGRPPPYLPEGSPKYSGDLSPGSMEFGLEETLGEAQSIKYDDSRLVANGYLQTYRTTRPVTNIL
jgi:hypothetical protein